MALHPRRLFARAGASLLALGLLTTALTAITLGSSATAAEARQPVSAHRTIQPVVDDNFADPDVLLVDGVYHAYATNSDGQNVQHRTSRNLRTWTTQEDVLPVLGDWVGPCSFAPGGATDSCVWAPEVTAVGDGYALYYTARDEASQRQCIGVATSSSPDGPFQPVGDDPLVCPTAQDPPDLGGAIDAGTYAEDGRLWLLWKSDGNCCSKPAIIFVQPLSADGTTLTGPATELVRNDQPWEGAVVEAPTLVKHDGTYYLFYSANDFGGGGYRTGFATASSLTGPYTKADTELLTSELFQGDVRGPGGQDVITTRDGSTAIVFHGWDPTFSYRAMYTSPLVWGEDGAPVVTAAATRYQAEDGEVTNARVVDDATASGGEKVGGLDLADSSVSVRVHADRAGRATLGIRYANGSLDDGRRVLSTDALAVNGEDAGTVTFQHTGWGSWQLVEARVKLDQGWNTVTLTKETFFAELDAVDVYDKRGEPAAPVYPQDPVDATRYEAEAGVVTNARVVGDDSASSGAKVGGLDFADSAVSVRVWAEQAGWTTLGIRFANGSERGGYPLEATHRLTVDGADAGLVTYPHTRWGNWQTIEHDAKLAQGWNTVTLTRVSWYAEIDAVDVLGEPSPWVGTWSAATAGTVPQDPGGYPDFSLRNVVHVSVGGSSVRVRLTNAENPEPLRIGHATVAVAAESGAPEAVPGTMRDLTIGGSGSPVLPAGATIQSDPVSLDVEPGDDLLVTVWTPDAGRVTWHPEARQTSFFSTAGDHAGDVSGAAFDRTTPAWYYVDEVDVSGSPAPAAVVALGDSITDGFASSLGTSSRYPDVLARRLQEAGTPLGVLNAGISGNRVLTRGVGPAAVDRVDRDVLSRSGVGTLVLLEGINDINDAGVTDPSAITDGLRRIADAAHARGIEVVGGTLLPYQGAGNWTAERDEVRRDVNAWIRTTDVFDAVVDFDAATQDPANPLRLRPEYDSGDHLHPSDAGYRAMAEAVPLRLLAPAPTSGR